MLPIERLADWYKLEPFPGFQNTVLYHIKTPAYHFIEVAMLLRSPDRYIVVSARNSFDAEFAAAILRAVEQQKARITFLPCVQKVATDLNLKPPLDHLLIVGPTAHETYSTEAPELHKVTFLALPIANCEFAGDEDPETVRLMRGRHISTLDWNRAVTPKVMMRYYNETIDIGSIGPGFRFARYDFCLARILEMKPGFPKSFVSIRNFLNRECTVSRPTADFVVESSVQKSVRPIVIPAEDIKNWVETFLFQGTSCEP